MGDYFVGLTLSNVKISESETEDVKVYVPYTIAKGTPTITTAPTASDITYGKKLSDSTLSGGAASVDGTFSWKTPTTAPTVADSNSTEYTVVFTPTDGTNYSAVETNVKLTVSKADPVYTTPTGLTATYGQTLANVTLPTADNGTWSWQDDPATTGVGDITVGEPRNFLAKFTPNDTDNYNIIEDVNIQITVTPAAASVAIAPTANTLTYTGSAQALVTAGTGTNGTMQYSTSQNGTYSTTIPTGTDAGSYTVWYKVVGDANHSDTTPASIAVTIAKASASVATAPTANDLTYTGSAQALVTAGTATGGTMQYSLDGTAYSAAVPTGKNVGSYTVYYKVAGDNNHNDTAAQSVSVSIAKADSSAETPTAKTDLVYTGSAQELVTAGTATGGELKYSLDGTDYSAAVPTATDAGDYTVYYKVVGDANHNDSTAEQIKVSIAKAASSVKTAPTAKTGLTATGSEQAIVNAGTAEGGELQYSLDGTTYSTAIPTATTAGTYTVYYKVVGDKNHTDTEAQTLTVTVGSSYRPSYPIYVPSSTTTNTTSTTTTTTDTTPDITKYTITGEQDELNESALAWDAIPNASAYALYVKVDGKYVFVQDLGKATNADIVLGSNGKYYVSTGGDYTIYEYNEKTGKLDKTGTLKASKIENIVKANNVTENFMVKYTINGKESAEKDSYKVSVKIYYKPAVKITANKGSITLKWNKVPEATKYRVYKYVNGKLKLVTETTKRSVKINGTKAGKEYTYAVKAYVDGKWTKVYTGDLASVTAK